MNRLTFCLSVSFLACMPRMYGEVYLQDESRSPDCKVAFAIIYPPTQPNPDRHAQVCFVHPETKQRVGSLFLLPGTDAETIRPGGYVFNHYKVFDYVWSADSSHLAIVHRQRYSSVIHPFRRRGRSFQPLEMPDLAAALTSRLTKVIQVSQNTSIEAKRWTSKQSLTATIAKEAQVTKSGNDNRDWLDHSLQFNISFNHKGKPSVKATEFRVQTPP